MPPDRVDWDDPRLCGKRMCWCGHQQKMHDHYEEDEHYGECAYKECSCRGFRPMGAEIAVSTTSAERLLEYDARI